MNMSGAIRNDWFYRFAILSFRPVVGKTISNQCIISSVYRPIRFLAEEGDKCEIGFCLLQIIVL